ncbi:Hypothetical predicted protein [Octopus vulgaris]|uniref:Uncharacterized protein n=1 Tax=Octopus vulgaris TaxID=6645 RepID=A0AA36AW97_OCTVU|nr:Hypothetical predicted protein [Octopus vulgaris]
MCRQRSKYGLPTKIKECADRDQRAGCRQTGFKPVSNRIQRRFNQRSNRSCQTIRSNWFKPDRTGADRDQTRVPKPKDQRRCRYKPRSKKRLPTEIKPDQTEMQTGSSLIKLRSKTLPTKIKDGTDRDQRRCPQRSKTGAYKDQRRCRQRSKTVPTEIKDGADRDQRSVPTKIKDGADKDQRRCRQRSKTVPTEIKECADKEIKDSADRDQRVCRQRSKTVPTEIKDGCRQRSKTVPTEIKDGADRDQRRF